MKKIVLRFLVIGMLFCTLTLNAQKLTVATYNIRYENAGDVSNGNGWEQRCPVICKMIQFHDFDISGHRKFYTVN